MGFCIDSMSNDMLSDEKMILASLNELNGCEVLRELESSTDLSVYSYDSTYSYSYIGLDISKMKDDETREQFRNRAIKLMNKVFSDEVMKNTKVSIITDGWAG